MLANKDPKVLAIVGNKCDLDNKRVIAKEAGEELAKEIGTLYFETSAKSGVGIDELFAGVTSEAIGMQLATQDDNLIPAIEYSPSSSNSCC